MKLHTYFAPDLVPACPNTTSKIKSQQKSKSNKNNNHSNNNGDEKKMKHPSNETTTKDNDNKQFKVVTNLFLLRTRLRNGAFSFHFCVM